MVGKVELFGIVFDSMTFGEALDAVFDAGRQRRKGLVVTPNVDHIVNISRDQDLRALYRRATLVLADGMPVVVTGRLSKDGYLPERVTGADLFPAIAERAAKEGLSIALVGGNPGVADRAADVLRTRYPGIRIVGTYCPPFGFEHDTAESESIVGLCNEWRPDFLFLGVGSPKQERWGDKHLGQLDVGPVLCVGAAFDFVAGSIKRAPRWMQKAGLEWAWRLLHEPRRLGRRYLGKGFAFLPLAMREIVK